MDLSVVGTFALVTFRYDVPGFDDPVIWNVTQALLEVEAGHVLNTVEVARDQMEATRDNNSWEPAKIETVDPSIPGIAAPMRCDGEVFYVLIDGTHRCVRALRDGLPFSARLLTDAAARRCVISAPAALLPWG